MAMTDNTLQTRNAFLYAMSMIYMFAFGSWFMQIPGLYGDDGLLPIRNVMQDPKNKSTEALFADKPTAVWFLLFYGFSHQVSLELICFLGTALSFFSLICQNLRCMPVFAILWFLYLSLFQVGQTFSWFQWDTLLLESGFLTILVATLNSNDKNSAHHKMAFFLVRWLLFRLMFASGVVKLTSMCPTWWHLTALNYHFETQCIPTPASWWTHQLPNSILKLGVVGTYVIEIGLPFLFFAPVRRLRLIGVYGQVLLMVTIIITGNYNFFNLLTIAFCLSAVDDEHLSFYLGKSSSESTDKKERASKPWSRVVQHHISNLLVLVTMSVYAYYTVNLFQLKITGISGLISSKIAFTKEDLWKFSGDGVTLGVWLSAIVFVWEAFSAFYLCMKGQPAISKPWSLVKYLAMLFVCVYMYCISMIDIEINDQKIYEGPAGYACDSVQSLSVTLSSLPNSRMSWPIIKEWHSATQKYELVHSYGLFRSMTGVEGRPEVIIEGSMSAAGPWKEIPFLYKPGDKKRQPPWIVPHQPRLDWQMWFAALGRYQDNIWFVNLLNKLMTGQKEVLKLIDAENYPFKDRPPSFIRAELYLYHFTRLRKDGSKPKAVWTRKLSKTYFPAVNKNDESLKKFLEYYKLNTKKSTTRSKTSRIENYLGIIRSYGETLSIPVLLWALYFTALTISWSVTYIKKARNTDQ